MRKNILYDMQFQIIGTNTSLLLSSLEMAEAVAVSLNIPSTILCN